MNLGFDAPTHRRYVVSRSVFFAGLALYLGVLIALIVVAFVRWVAEGVGVGLVSAFGLEAETNPGWMWPLLAFIGFVVLPIVLFMPVLVPLAVTWKNPRRIVVFRRFHTAGESKALRRVALHHLSPFGHVFTLADTQIHRSLFVRIPFLLGQLSLLNFRLRRVHSAASLNSLRQTLSRQWRLNLNWLLSPRKIFPIHTSDEFWQSCVGLLLEKADLIVMDVTGFSTHMAWEIAECRRRNLFPKILLIGQADPAAQANAAISSLQMETTSATLPAGIPVFSHNQGRILEPDPFGERINTILAESNRPPAPAAAAQVALTIGANFALSLFLATACLAIAAPFLFPWWTSQHSPIKSQVLAVYYRQGDLSWVDRLAGNDWPWMHGQLRHTATTGSDLARRNALRAIGHWGNADDIPLLVDGVARASAGRSDAERLRKLFRWGYPEEEALSDLMMRLGRPGLPPLLNAIGAAPTLPFDLDLHDDLYVNYIEPNAIDADDPLFARLLQSPNQAGRFIAALHLGARRDSRAAPGLRELVSAASPSFLADHADDLLRRLPAGP